MGGDHLTPLTQAPSKRDREDTLHDDERPLKRIAASQSNEEIPATIPRLLTPAATAAALQAKAGVIAQITLQNFMCHENFTLKLNPNINILTGRNGSGKSAIMTALLVCLGSRASITMRAPTLKDLIRHHATSATITVELWNEGERAFKPRLYGNVIKIQRRITNTTTQYKIMSASGEVKATKADDLRQILNHYGLQIDNPVNFLTQELAKQFLNSAKPTELYAFFKKGTLLEEIETQLQIATQEIQTAQEESARISDTELPKLEHEFSEAERAHRSAEMMQNLQARIQVLNSEKEWCRYYAVENNIQGIRKQAEAARLQAAKAEHEFAKKQEERQQLEAQVQEKRSQQERLRNQLEKADALLPPTQNPQLRKKMDEKANINDDIKDLRDTDKTLSQEAQRLREKIQEEKRKLQDSRHRTTLRDIQDKLQKARQIAENAANDAENFQANHRALATRIAETQRRFEEDWQNYQEAERNLRNADGECRKAQEQLENLQAARSGDRAQMFGPKMRQILNDIDRVQWSGAKPLGPFGMYMKVKDPKWGRAIEAYLGKTYTNFLVENIDDRDALFRILEKHSCSHYWIVIEKYDESMDFQSGIPQGYLTCLNPNVLEISKSEIRNVLVTQVNIEQNVLVDTREEADLTSRVRNVRTAWLPDGTRFANDREGGRSVIPNYGKFHNVLADRDSDREARLSDAKHNLERAVDNLQRLRREMPQRPNDADDELKALRRDQQQFIDKARKAKAEVVRQENLVKTLEDEMVANDDSSFSNLPQLENELKGVEGQISNNMNQLNNAVEELRAIKADIQALQQEHQSKQAEYAKKQQDLEKIREEINYLISRSAQFDVVVNTARENAETFVQQANRFEDQARINEESLATIAQELGEQGFHRPENPSREERKILLEIKRLNTNAEVYRERMNSKSLEELKADMQDKSSRLDAARRRVLDCQKMQEALVTALRNRQLTFSDTKKRLTVSVTQSFETLMMKRKMLGECIIDHQAQTLTIKAQKLGEGTNEAENIKRDTRHLSGGERSFATICLLLSIWSSTFSPIRTLDEFDVFMDVSNRQVSLSFLTQFAKQRSGHQLILISPLMTQLPSDPQISVHTMSA